MAELPRPNYPLEVAVYKKLKNFVKDFKEENKRLPSKKEIQRGTGSDYNAVTKYLDEGKDFLTNEQSRKLKAPPVEAADLNPAQKEWYKKNKNYLFVDKKNNFRNLPDDFMSLTNDQRFRIREQYKNRATTGLNHPRVRLMVNEKKLENFLQSEINKIKPNQNVIINSQRNEYIKKNKLPKLTEAQTKKVFDKFNGRFVFKNQKLLEIPGMEKEIIELAKTKGPKDIIKTLEQLIKEKKISKIMPSDPEQLSKDKLVKDFIKNNPTEESSYRIAKAISANENIKMSKNFVESAVERLGLKSKFISLHAKIYPQVKSLDIFFSLIN